MFLNFAELTAIELQGEGLPVFGLQFNEVVRDTCQFRNRSKTSPQSGHLSDFLKLCMKTFFKFQKLLYEQMKVTPVGSSFLGYMSAIVLQRLPLSHP